MRRRMQLCVFLAAVLITSGFFFLDTSGDSPLERNRALLSGENEERAGGNVTFTDVALEKGFAGVGGSFMSWGDYNNDGYMDLLINGRRLFRNNGPPEWNFTDVTTEAGIGGSVGNGVWGDYNNDGWLDFYAGAGLNRWDILWKNNGNGTFSNVTIEAGNVYDLYPTSAAGWGDYDNDGFADLYVANGEDWNGGNPIYYPDILYHNNGDGTFSDVTVSAGINDTEHPYYGRGVAWGDYNNDGLIDVYVSNYRIVPNYLWENRGNGTFYDVAFEKNVAGDPHSFWYYGPGKYYGHTIGSSWADINNDGYLDLFTANLAHKDTGPAPWYRGYICDDSKLYLNNGPPNFNFTDIREEAGIPITPPGTTYGGYYKDETFSNAAWADYDNDGDLDLWIVQVYDELKHAHSYLYSNNYSDKGTLTFENVTWAAGVFVWDTYAGAWADFDNDGDMDLVTGGKIEATQGAEHRLRLFQNNGNNNSWLNVKLVGCDSNRWAIGARVTVSNGTSSQLRQVEAGMGSHSQMNSMILHYGFGSYHGMLTVDVLWPGGLTQTIEHVTLNQTLTIAEPSCLAAPPTNVSIGFDGTKKEHVNISWAPSADDGQGKDNVVSYSVYYNDTYVEDGFGYHLLATIPAGSSYFVHLFGGNGDPNTYFYYVQANCEVGVPAQGVVLSNKNNTQLVKYARMLPVGKHLISIPVHSNDYSVGSVLSTVRFDMVAYYNASDKLDHWKEYSRNKFYYTDLNQIDPRIGVWVNVTENSTFVLLGYLPEGASMDLKRGWNLIGYPSIRERTVGEVLAGLPVVKVEGFNMIGPYYLRELSTSDSMLPGYAYWVKVSRRCTLHIS